MGRSPVRHGSDAGEELVLALVREQAGELLRFARRFSICVEDAQDAYQRTLEKLVRRVRSEPPEHAGKWVRTVLRNEALAIRAEREQMLGRMTLEDERHRDAAALDPAERVERFEQLAHTAEALRGLKPQEVTALALRAEGLSYKEICARTGWTYTRCNRAVSEGRRALLTRLRAIESGADCERWLPLLSLLADGEASARELAQLRPHLRTCPACRATLRRFHAAPQQVAALLPALPALVGVGSGAAAVASVAPGGGGVADAAAAGISGTGSAAGAVEEVTSGSVGVGRHLEAALHGLAERANTTILRFHSAIDALPGAKLAAVAASTVAVAGGGAAIEQAATTGGAASGGTATAALVVSDPATSAGATPISTGTAAPTGVSTTTAALSTSPASSAAASAPAAGAGSAPGPLAEFALEPFGAVADEAAASTNASAFGAPAATASAGTGGASTSKPADGARSSSTSTSVPAGTAVFLTPSTSPSAAGATATPPRPATSTNAAHAPRPNPEPRTSQAPARPEFPTTAPVPDPAPAPTPRQPQTFSQPHPAALSGAEFAGP